MKEISVCAAFLIIGLATTSIGIALLTVRYQQQAPPEYREASINYQARPIGKVVRVVVAEGDVATVQQRISKFIQNNQGQVTHRRPGYLTAQVPENVAQALATLHTKGARLTYRYRDWPHGNHTVAGSAGAAYSVKIKIVAVPYRKLMRDAGISTGVGGAITTVMSATALIASILNHLDNNAKRRP